MLGSGVVPGGLTAPSGVADPLAVAEVRLATLVVEVAAELGWSAGGAADERLAVLKLAAADALVAGLEAGTALIGGGFGRAELRLGAGAVCVGAGGGTAAASAELQMAAYPTAGGGVEPSL